MTITAYDAWRLAPLPTVPPGDTTAPMLIDVPPRQGVVSELMLLAAVGKDPFRPDRQRPSTRYLLPGHRPPPRPPGRLPYAGIQLLGTAVLSAGGDLASLQIPGKPPQVVRVGQEFAGLTLLRVERGVATLAGPDTTVTVRLSGSAAESTQ
jgi:hypothetical protein